MNNSREDMNMKRSHRSVVILLLGVMLLGLFPLSTSAEGLFSLDSTHKYLGFGTVALAGATAVSNGDIDIHEPLAYATAAFAVSTVLTGFLAHHERFDLSEGLFSQDNLHIVAATVGAIALTAAVFMAADSYDEEDDSVDKAHIGLGVTGGVLMTLAIVDIEW